MKIFLVFVILLQINISFSQNLVINGDFELYDSCPQTAGNVNGFLQDVYNPFVESTSDFYHTCSPLGDLCNSINSVNVPSNDLGFLNANSGLGYGGLAFHDILNNYREYLVFPLVSTLKKDTIYTITMYVSKAALSGKATDGIMVAFTNDSVPIQSSGWQILDLDGVKMTDSVITSTNNWVKLTRNYIASGIENYIIVGNFLNNGEYLLETHNYFPLYCPSGGTFGYSLSSYYYVDNISVESSNSTNLFPNFFTPNNDGVNDFYNQIAFGYEVVEFDVFNRWGNKVYSISNSDVNWDGKDKNGVCTEGVYFYVAQIRKNQTEEIIIKQGNISLFK